MPNIKETAMESILDTILGTARNIFSALGYIIAAFPKTFTLIGLVILSTGIYMLLPDSAQRTLPQQITYRATHGGSIYWVMELDGTEDAGFFEAPSAKKEYAKFAAAVKYCSANKSHVGCSQVLHAADTTAY
jgi:hypothetical protein